MTYGGVVGGVFTGEGGVGAVTTGVGVGFTGGARTEGAEGFA